MLFISLFQMLNLKKIYKNRIKLQGSKKEAQDQILRSYMLNDRKCKMLQEKKLGAIKRESGNVEVLWIIIKKCVLGTMSDLVEKVKRRAKKPWITQETVSTMDK